MKKHIFGGLAKTILFSVALAAMLMLSVTVQAEEQTHSCNAGYTYGAEGGMLVEHCTVKDCTHQAFARIEYPPFKYTQTFEASFVYDGMEKNGATILKDDNWQGADPVLTYEDNVNVGIARVYATMTGTNGESASAVYVFKITEAPVSVSMVSAQGRVYDGTNKVNILSLEVNGIIDSDDVSVNYSGLKGTLPSADAGTYNEITLSGVTLKGEHGSNYKIADGKYALSAPIVISKAENAPDMPNAVMDAPFSCKTVGDVSLPWGWKWSDADKVKGLSANVPLTATAVYDGADKNNYNNVQKQITITRSACEHAWDSGVITKKPTALKKGVRTYKCSACQAVRTENISPLGAPAVGKKFKGDDGKATYKITKSSLTKGTVEYVKPVNKKKSTVSVPATVKIDGVTYKVTSIAKNAFKDNKYIKNLTIGKNVSQIGAKAFYKCINLKTVKISTTKLTSKKIGSKAFYGIKSKAVIKVPKKKYSFYKKLLRDKGAGKKVSYKKF